MKVLYVIDSLAVGGAERSLVELLPYVSSVEMFIALLHRRGGLETAAEAAGATVVDVEGATRAAKALSLQSHLRRIRPAIVHTTLFDADVLGRSVGAMTRVPVVSSVVNEVVGLAAPSVKLRLVRGLDRLTIRKCRLVHAVSEPVARSAERELGVPRKKLRVVPRGRDRARLGIRTTARRSSAREALGLSDDQIFVLAVGRQEPQKAFADLVRTIPALRRLSPSVELRIAGRPARDTPAIEAACREVGLERDEVLLGERSDVPDLVCAADVVVISSTREGMPGVALEAMALGTPVVARPIDSVRTVLGDLGFYGEPASWPELITVASSIDDDHRMALVYRFDTNHDLTTVGQRMVALWSEAAS